MGDRLPAIDRVAGAQGRGRGVRARRGGAVVLVAGALSTLALAWAALVVMGDAEAGGRLAAARLAGDVSDAVVDELQRWSRSWRPDDADFAAEQRLAWAAAPPVGSASALSPGREAGPAGSSAGGPAPALEWRVAAAGPPTACDTLLSEALRAEQQGGREQEALELVLDALAVAGDPRREAEALLRSLQLAARLRRADLVVSQWRLARDRLDAGPTRDGTSSLLLCALSAAPFLDPDERHRAWQQLVALWLAGQVQLSGAPSTLRLEGERLVLAEGRLRQRWRERLTALAAPTEAGAQEVAAFEALDIRRLRAEAARALLPEVLQPTRPGELQLLAVDGGWLAWRPDAAGGVQSVGSSGGQGLLLADAQLRRLWHEHLDRSGVVPEGFVVALVGDESPSGAELRAVQVLPGGGPGVALRHEDQGALVTGLAWQRTVSGMGLLLAAAFSAVASLATWRALRRQARLDRLKSAFVASVSHELRTPVASILLMAENLEQGRVTDAAARDRYHGLMRRESQRLGRLVNDVLDFSRLERGEPARLRREPLELAGFLDALCDEVHEHARRRNAQLTIERQEREQSVVVALDQDALCRAILNLVENALVHGAAGSSSSTTDVAAELNVSFVDDALRLALRDYGPGVPSGRRGEIFKPFSRGEQTSAGMGLGLSIVAAIVEGHGGTVTVSDPPEGPGVVFTVTLPCDELLLPTGMETPP